MKKRKTGKCVIFSENEFAYVYLEIFGICHFNTEKVFHIILRNCD